MKSSEKYVQNTYGIEYIIKHLPYQKFDSILDIGVGNGFATNHFLKMGKKVTAIGLNIDAYDPIVTQTKYLDIIEGDFMTAFVSSKKFDAIWASHIMEHMENPGFFLDRIRKLLKQDGILFLTVPSYKSTISGGHLMTGWSIGQLLYFLAVKGFDVRSGNFIRYGYNVSAFVRRSNSALPKLMHDRGDFDRLKNSSILPNYREIREGWDGDVYSLNWNYPIDRKEKIYRFKVSTKDFINSLLKYLKKIKEIILS